MITRQQQFSLGITLGILILLVVGLYQKLARNPDPDFLSDRAIMNEEYGFQLSAPQDWSFLNIPNSILNYPRSEAQLIHKSRKVFCVLIPELIQEGDRVTMDRFLDMVRTAILKESPNAAFESEIQVPSSWSERMRLIYSSTLNVLHVKWFIQLDLTPKIAYRTIGWCDQEAFASHLPGFQEIGDSLQEIRSQKKEELGVQK